MDALQAIGLISGIASIAGFIYAIYYARQSHKAKLFVYGVSFGVTLAEVSSPEGIDDYDIAVTFKRTGLPEERFESVYVQFVTFANLGKEPIRRDDIAPANPLKITIKDARTLDIKVESPTRSVNSVELVDQFMSEGISCANISFDFLDYKDGAIIRILTANNRGSVSIEGDVIGMPEGIKKIDEMKSPKVFGKLGCGLAIILQLAALSSALSVYYRVVGSWENAWLLLLPLIALILPLFIVLWIGATVWPSDQEPDFPDNLRIPTWPWSARRSKFFEK